MSAQRSRVLWIDHIRGAAILLVVLFHSTTLLRFGFEVPSALTAMNAAASPFRMSALAVVAGFISVMSLEKDRRAFFSGKLRNLVWPYLIWTVVYLLTAGAIYTPLNHQLYISYLWYLPFLFVCYATIYFIPRNAIWITAVVSMTVAAAIPADIEAAQRAFYLLALFMAGALLNNSVVTESLYRLHPAFIAVMIFLAGLASFYAASGHYVRYNPAWLGAVFCGIFAFIYYSTHTRADTKARATLAFAGQNSIVFYVTHFPVIYLVVLSLEKVAPGLNPYVVSGIAALVALTVGALLVWASRTLRIVAWLFSFGTPNRRETASKRAPA